MTGLSNPLGAWFWRAAYLWRSHRLRNHEPELAILSALVEPSKLALDIGANRALFTTRLRKLARGVHAFEPVPHLAARLRGAFPDITVHEVALSNAAGTADLRLPGSNTSWATIEAGNQLEKAKKAINVVTVQTKRLDDVQLGPVGFVKIDVEGHELAVIEGARELLARDRPTMLVELEQRHTPNAVPRAMAAMAELGYGGLFLDGGKVRPLSEFDQDRDQPPSNVSEKGKQGRYLNNFIFAFEPKLAGVRDRITLALQPRDHRA